MIGFLKEFFTVYTTTRLIRVRSPFIAILNTVLIVVVFGSFLLSIDLDPRKLYQKQCPVRGVIVTKVKGFASTENLTNEELSVPNADLYRRSWDAADIVYPAHGGEGSTGSFTIVTNMIITPNQTLGTCAEKSSPLSECKRDSDCDEGYWSPRTHGVFTGKCIVQNSTCEIKGWCPIQSGRELPRKGEKPLLEGVQDFTLMLKNSVEFPDCGNFPGKNIRKVMSHEYLKNCTYHPIMDPSCPIFKIGDIVTWSGANFSGIGIRGGVIRILVEWKCDFDFGRTAEDCQPTYKFIRVDHEANASKGLNFRYADFYSDDRRTLRKQFGLKIIIDLQGAGSQFTFYLLGITIGATIGFFSVVPLACDLSLDLFNKLCKTSGMEKLPFHDGSVSRYAEESVDGTSSSKGTQRNGAANRNKLDNSEGN